MTRRRLAKTLTEIDHRTIGQRQNLFFFNEFSKGSCFFQPRGAHIYNKLIDYLRSEYKLRQYEEIITPNIYDCRLWQMSGHWDHYESLMMKFKLGEFEFSLKPMNCPGHCLMYKNLGHITSDQLPIRWADFGALHRNEYSGALSGLSRLRRFQQDDAHIFCTPEQVQSEVQSCLDFAKHVYTEFGFTFDIALSLRPEKYLGDATLWDQAEDSLRCALTKLDLDYKEQKFEGAFYGPKIDLIIKDCLERAQQCATIQLDFQLPQRFELVYKSKHNEQLERPVMIHRAILGSIERFIAMLAEHTGGLWPFWLSPLQAVIIPIREDFNGYALNVRDRLIREGFMVDCELDHKTTLGKKIRDAKMSKCNFVLVVGNKETEAESVTARISIDKKTHQLFMSVDRLIELFKVFREKRTKQVDKEMLVAFS